MKKWNEMLNGITDKHDDKMALAKKNYLLLLVGFALVVLGLVLMTGGKSASPEEFNYAMFSFRRITLAPILIVAGFVFEIYAILKK